MWEDFSDFELVELAGNYGLEDYIDFNADLTLANREEIETLLEEVEYNMAFGD